MASSLSILKLLSYISPILLIIFYLKFPKRNADKKFRVIFLYAVISFIWDVLLTIYSSGHTYFYLTSFYTLIEFTAFSTFFYFTFKERFLNLLGAIFLLIFLGVFLYYIRYNFNDKFDSITSSIAGILVIILCILFFYEQLKNPEINFIYAAKSFWVVIGCLIYASLTLFLFISIGGLKLNEDQQNKIWAVNLVANIIKNVLFGIAIYKPLNLPIDSSIRTSKK